MAQILFNNGTELTNEWLFYIQNEAKSLSQRERFTIENYLDRELFNPEMKSFLSMENVITALNNVQVNNNLNLNFFEDLNSKNLQDWVRPRFGRMKEKVRQVFCSVVSGMGDLDANDIIKAVLIALIPAFGLAGFAAALLPIVIGIVAYFIKYGIEKTCPVL